jgi:hypothetical protein
VTGRDIVRHRDREKGTARERERQTAGRRRGRDRRRDIEGEETDSEGKQRYLVRVRENTSGLSEREQGAHNSEGHKKRDCEKRSCAFFIS